VNNPLRDTGEDETPKGDCLPCPHVHCEFCEFTIPTVPDQRDALRDILIHIRTDHPEEWQAPENAEFRAGAPEYGVESL
jgi:hypothetical protein